MAILSICPHCGAKHKLADDSKIGKKIRCRECEEPFVVQQARSPAANRPAKSAAGGAAPSGLPPRTVGVKSKKKKKTKPAKEEAAKKPKKKAKSGVGQSPALIGGICVLVLALLIGVPLLFFGEDEPVQQPASYAKFSHSVEQTFQCEYPAGWTVESGGTSGVPVWAKFENGEVKIRVRSSMGASAIGDIAKNTGGNAIGVPGGDLDEDLAPAAKVHEFMKEQFAQDYSDYQEIAPKTIKTGFGDTRVSEFTASGSWDSTIRGMRASMLGLNLQYTVICDCPEKDWDVCREIFDRVIKSMSRG